MIKGKNILIVCYGFPPNPGIGGRRWAKFSKYLSQSGYNVNVIAAKNIFSEKSDWLNDIKGISVEYLPVKYPKVLIKGPSSFVEKLQYRFWIYFLRLIYRGNYYDRSVFWKHQIQKSISKKISKEEVDTVIVTSGPFMLSYYVLKLKLKYPHVKFITDFRDSWTQDIEISSFAHLSNNRKLIEKDREQQTIFFSDMILTVADNISNYFRNLTNNKRVYTLPNGFDSDDFKHVKQDTISIKKDDKIRLIFTGTLYINLSYILEPFFKEINNICSNDIELRKRLIIEFYGTFPKEYLELINKFNINNNIKIHGKIPLYHIYNVIQTADLCLLFLNDCYRFALSTKFCEYISQNKKVLLLSHSGEAAEFINSYKLGFTITPENCQTELLKIINQFRNMNSNYTQKSNVDNIVNQFSLPYLTNKLIHLMHSNIN